MFDAALDFIDKITFWKEIRWPVYNLESISNHISKRQLEDCSLNHSM